MRGGARRTQSLCFVLAVGLLCLWRSYWPLATSTARKQSSKITLANSNETDFKTVISTINQYVNQQSKASCSHKVYNMSEWMLVVESSFDDGISTLLVRTHVPLTKITKDPSRLAWMISSASYVSITACRRDCCSSGGSCLNDTFPLHLAITTAYTPQRFYYSKTNNKHHLCQTPMELAQNLDNGAWIRRANGQESWYSPVCKIPSAEAARNVKTLQQSQKQVLFIGDSTLQELAHMVAHYADPNPIISRNSTRLNCTCTKAYSPKSTTKDCRNFYATSSLWNTSMLWAGHTECHGNNMGILVIHDDNWKSKVVRTMETMRPDVLLFQVPISHSCPDYYSCKDALEQYIQFTTSFIPSSQVVLVISGAIPSRQAAEGPSGRHCPSLMRRWISNIRNVTKRLAPHVFIVDIFTPTEQWVNLIERDDPFLPPCVSMERHLTCDFFASEFMDAVASPKYVLPPGRLAADAIIHLLSIIDSKANSKTPNE